MYRVELYVRVRRDCMVDGKGTREASSVFRGHTDTIRKMLSYSVPQGYRRKQKCPINCNYGTLLVFRILGTGR